MPEDKGGGSGESDSWVIASAMLEANATAAMLKAIEAFFKSVVATSKRTAEEMRHVVAHGMTGDTWILKYDLAGEGIAERVALEPHNRLLHFSSHAHGGHYVYGRDGNLLRALALSTEPRTEKTIRMWTPRDESLAGLHARFDEIDRRWGATEARLEAVYQSALESVVKLRLAFETERLRAEEVIQEVMSSRSPRVAKGSRDEFVAAEQERRRLEAEEAADEEAAAVYIQTALAVMDGAMGVIGNTKAKIDAIGALMQEGV